MHTDSSTTARPLRPETHASRRLDAAKRDALATLAHFYLRHRRIDRAITLLTAMHKLDAADVQTSLSLAWAWLLKGNPEITLRLSSAALGRGDRLGRAARLLQARALIRLDRDEEARRLLQPQATAASSEVA